VVEKAVAKEKRKLERLLAQHESRAIADRAYQNAIANSPARALVEQHCANASSLVSAGSAPEQLVPHAMVAVLDSGNGHFCGGHATSSLLHLRVRGSRKGLQLGQVWLLDWCGANYFVSRVSGGLLSSTTAPWTETLRK
jgi:hypothetical protein